MKMAVGADHAGFERKEVTATFLRGQGHVVLDPGTCDSKPVDDPDYAEAVGKAILEGRAGRGVLICGSGVGASVAANKVKGIRAGLCHDHYSVRQGVEDDDMNILCLGGRVMGIEVAWDHAQTFVSSSFSGAERNRRRLETVARVERESTSTG